MKGDIAVLYRALRPVGLFPPEIRRMELWECAVLLGEDEQQLILPGDVTTAVTAPTPPEGPLGATLVHLDAVGTPDPGAPPVT